MFYDSLLGLPFGEDDWKLTKHNLLVLECEQAQLQFEEARQARDRLLAAVVALMERGEVTEGLHNDPNIVARRRAHPRVVTWLDELKKRSHDHA